MADKKKKIFPPSLAEALLMRVLKADLAEEILGDLEEKFYKTVTQRSAWQAKLNYWYQVFNYMRPFAIKNWSNSKFNNMYQHNLKIGIRNILNNKGYSLLNLCGLTIAMVVTLFIGLWVHDELSFNKYHDNYDDIAQIYIEHHNPNQDISTGTSLPPALGPLLEQEYSNYFEEVVLMRSHPEERILSTPKGDFTSQGSFMQPDGIKLFSLDMLTGSTASLKEINSIIISASLAERIFGTTEVQNKMLTMNGGPELLITGVYRDLPDNSFLSNMTFFAPLDLYMRGWSSLDVWDNYYLHAYVKTGNTITSTEASHVIKDLILPHLSGPGKRYLFVKPMSQWHLYSSYENGHLVTSKELKYVRLFSGIGLFVLLLAVINFINLSTARSEHKAKEVGIRKSIGSGRGQLIQQFLSESLIISLSSYLLAVSIVALTLSWLNNLSGKEITLPVTQPQFWLIGLSIAIAAGIMAGCYPAFYLSSLNPYQSLKHNGLKGSRGIVLRKILVTTQFSISIILIVSMIIVYQQIEYTKNRPLGYDKSNLLVIPKLSADMYGNYDALSNKLLKSGAVISIGEANYPLTNTLGNNNGFKWPGKDENYDPSFNTILVNADYGKTIDWKIIEGRDFDANLKTDISQAVIISESAKELIGLEEIVGTTLTFDQPYFGGPNFTVVGVAKDMVKHSPFHSAKPAIMFLTNKELGYMFLKINPDLNVSQALTQVEDAIANVAPSAVFNYSFMDDEYNSKFRTEERIRQLISLFAILAILISCIGLFGLVSFMTEKRTKEIGIRKVLGATTANLWRILSTGYLIPVLVSLAIATPLSYLVLSDWLSQYDYRIDISWTAFAIGGTITLLITILTVSFKTISSARINPILNLRAE